MDPIIIYNLDQIGVIVDTSPLGNSEGSLTKAQNAIADPLGDLGSIRKRPGLKQFNAVAADGEVQGGVSIPINLGSAGPDFQNPFTDSPVSAAAFYRPVFVLQGLSIPKFDDDSDVLLPEFEDFFDFGPYPDDEIVDWEEFSEDLSPQQLDAREEREAIIEAADQPDDVAAFNDVFNSPEAPSGYPGDVNRGTGPGGSSTSASPLTTSTPSTLYALTIIGSGSDWYVGLNNTLTEHFDNASSFSNPATLLFPETDLRADSTLTDWYTGGSTSALRGRSMTVLNGAIIYVQA